MVITGRFDRRYSEQGGLRALLWLPRTIVDPMTEDPTGENQKVKFNNLKTSTSGFWRAEAFNTSNERRRTKPIHCSCNWIQFLWEGVDIMNVYNWPAIMLLKEARFMESFKIGTELTKKLSFKIKNPFWKSHILALSSMWFFRSFNSFLLFRSLIKITQSCSAVSEFSVIFVFFWNLV